MIRVTPIFLAFAGTYFLAALVRAAIATLSPALAADFSLGARDLGLLGGSYFLAFAAVQLPMGQWLDRLGPRRVVLCFMAAGVLGLAAFAMARSFTELVLARALCGAGLAACLMAPLTGYRRWFSRPVQLRLGSWMLVASSLGAMASTLPVQWAVNHIGWRALFVGLALAMVVAMLIIARIVPRWDRPPAAQNEPAPPAADTAPGYAVILRHPYFRRMAPIGFFAFGGMSAMQTLWAGPWLVKVAGSTPQQASIGLLLINLTMLVSYFAWGMAAPRLALRGFDADRLMRWAFPLCFPLLGTLAFWPGGSGAVHIALLACYLASCSVLSLSTPAMAMRFESGSAGRALSAYNLCIFLGVFVVQWSFGLLVDYFLLQGPGPAAAFRATLGVFLLANVLSWAWMVFAPATGNQPAKLPAGVG